MKSLLFVFTVIILDMLGCGPRRYHEEKYLNVNAIEVIIDNTNGARGNISVTSNLNWDIIKKYGGEWLDVHPQSGNGNADIIITAKSSNESIYDRSCILIVYSEDIQRKVVVTQMGK